jgi:oligoribonuclease
MSDDTLVWFDCETTGLDPRVDQLLEIAVILTDGQLQERAVFEKVLHFDGLIGDDWVRNQHTKSGLLEACHYSDCGRSSAASQLSLFLEKNGIERKSGVLAGSSIHFDRGFIREHLPLFDADLHYRMVDVSSFNEVAKRFAPDLYATRPDIAKEEIAHRALPDIRHSISVLRHYLAAGAFGATRQ